MEAGQYQQVAASAPTPGADTGRAPEQLPPGPRLPMLVQELFALGVPHRTFPALCRRYGDRFTMRFFPVGRRAVTVFRPDEVRDVFAGSTEVFLGGAGNTTLRPVLGDNSVLLQDGAAHARSRGVLMRAFGRRELDGYRELVEEVTAAALETWPRSGEIRAHIRINRLTLEIIMRVLFGITDAERLRKMRPLVTSTVELGPLIVVGLQIPALHRLRPWSTALRDQAELRRLLHEEIEAARRDPALPERRDLLARLLSTTAGTAGQAADRGEVGAGMDDDEIVDQLVTLLAAGHETTATAISWALLDLAHDPALQRRCTDALETGTEDPRALLDAVVKESLRLHPVVWLVLRETTAPTTVGGRRYSSGISFAPSVLLAHRDPRNFPDPGRYDPDRFLGETPPPTRWMPFGGGARRCLGAGFALMEAEAILRLVLERYSLAPVGERMEAPRARNVSLYPARRARIVLTPRG